jgi:hypothetical protein
METFESVIFNCPECYQTIEVHLNPNGSASGPYYEGSVPKVFAEPILGNIVYFPSCGDRFTIMIDTNAPILPLFLHKG